MDQWILDQTQHDPTGPASDTDTGTGNDSGPDHNGDSGPDHNGDSGPEDTGGDGKDGTGGDGKDGTGGDGGGGGGTPPPQPGGPAQPGGGTRIAALINLTLPLTTLLELGTTPGDAGPFGPLDPAATRDLARTAATHPGTRWCLTLTDRHGHPTAHACARGPHPWAGLTPRDGPGTPDGLTQSSPGPDPPPDPNHLIARFLTGLKITPSPIAQGTCDHHDAEPGYTPSRKLRHKIHTRTPTCSYWGCRRPAHQCDDDHTTAWQRGGLTCQCNLAPLCRRHHRMKQREGWTLTQPQPGIMTWQTPSGRRYVTTPAKYTS
jgi:hypothetical protein